MPMPFIYLDRHCDINVKYFKVNDMIIKWMALAPKNIYILYLKTQRDKGGLTNPNS